MKKGKQSMPIGRLAVKDIVDIAATRQQLVTLTAILFGTNLIMKATIPQ